MSESGGAGIRTQGRVAPSAVFKTAQAGVVWFRERPFGVAPTHLGALRRAGALRCAQVGTKSGTKFDGEEATR